jgi:hypothetical protein
MSLDLHTPQWRAEGEVRVLQQFHTLLYHVRQECQISEWSRGPCP